MGMSGDEVQEFIILPKKIYIPLQPEFQQFGHVKMNYGSFKY